MQKTEKHSNSKKLLILVVAILCCLVTIGGTVAFLLTQTGEIENVFSPSKVTCQVDETFENNVKSDVSIKNTGNTDAFIRAAIIVTWVDKDTGNTLPAVPILDTDYEMTLGTSGWTKNSDGYYYCSSSIAPNGNTPVLISECKMKDSANIPENATLSVEIVASAIQSKPSSVVQDKWGISLGGNTKDQ